MIALSVSTTPSASRRLTTRDTSAAEAPEAAVEDQASDRAHRIGQTRPVTVYRLVASGTIEEPITRLHRTKRDLADRVLAGTAVAGARSAEELAALITDRAREEQRS